MTREQAKESLIALGVAEPSDEAITSYLNTLQNATKSAEDKAIRYKAEADKVKELEKQLDALNSQNLSEVEKANKATEDAMKQVADLQKTVMQMQRAKELAEIGIVGEQAEEMFNTDGSLNVAKLGEIITGREKTAVANFEKDALLKTPNPEGGKPDKEDIKPEVEYAKGYVARAKATVDAHSIVDNYA